MKHAIMGATKENYEDLMWAVVHQACLDYDEHPEKLPEEEKRNAESAKWFLEDPDNPYFDHLDLDGKTLINQMKKNKKVYGKYVLSSSDLEELKLFGRILSEAERELFRKEKRKKKKNSNTKLYNFKKETKNE